MASAVTRDQVAAHMGFDPAPPPGDIDGQHLDACVAAVNAMVPGIVPSIRPPLVPSVPPAPVPDWPDDVMEGAVILAARLFARRNSPTGVSAFSELGGPAYLSKFDSDVERLFRIGRWLPPGVG